MKTKTEGSPRPLMWIRPGDWDGFFGLLIDNLLQLMLITILSQYACGFSERFVTTRLLPGAALSIVVGNIFYTWQARRLAVRSGRSDVTALPFGINTVSLLAFVFLVMGPVYADTGDSDLAWKVGLAACFLSGLIETAGAFVGGWIRKHTPRPALLSGLAGVALSFMVVSFSFQVFAYPSIALIPALLILIVYSGRVRLPGRLPVGLVAVLVGVALAWIFKAFGQLDLSFSKEPLKLGFYLPVPVIRELASVLFSPTGWRHISVILPLAFFNVIGSIQNLESAEAAGDSFKSRSSLLVNGSMTLLASVLGSPFPTSIYIGHPGWKAMGARIAYSSLSGIAIAIICVCGATTAILKVIPMEAALGILLWIGLVIVGQAFTQTEDKHEIAVVVGLIPALAAWALHLIEASLQAAGTTLFEAAERFQGQIYIHGVLSLYQGFLLIGVLLSAIVTRVIDRKFVKAAGWCFAAAIFSAFGLIHAYTLTPNGVHGVFGWMAAPRFAGAYAVVGALLLVLRFTKEA